MFEHNLEWWNARINENVIIFRYEDMKSDLEGTVHRVAKFIG